MENVALPPAAVTQPLAGIASPKTTDQKAEVKAERVTQTQNAPKNLLEQDPQKTRLEAVKQAARAALTNPYPVSDVRFTIYQEHVQGGILYVTRFTSLRDGKVTLVQEPTLLAQTGSANDSGGTLLTTSA